MPPRRRGKGSAFTLVEMLVATAILALLLVLVAQLTNSASNTVTGSRKRLDADGEARLVFDRMANDFDRMLKRKDVDYVFAKRAGNDFMFFYSEAPGYFNGANSSDKSPISLTGYRISTQNPDYPSSPVLERLGKALAWDGAPGSGAAGSPVFLTYPPASPSPAPSPTPFPESTLAGAWPAVVTDTSTDSDFYLMGDGVYRLELSFLLTDGTISNTPYLPATGSVNGLADVSAIIVGLGILDPASRKIVSNPATMVAALPDSNDGEEIARTWTDADYLAQSGIPQAAASQIRTYQRYFYLKK